MKLFYDLHIHSCLSPCADDDMLPSDIAGIGTLNNLSIMALTDHNTCENCPAFFEACDFYGIIPIAGMELTTAEDIHVVCLLKSLEDALKFSDEVYDRIMPIYNKPEIFGNQNVSDADGNIIHTIDKLLISATDITIDEVPDLVKQYNGICYPAHIDRESNGIIAILGDIPPEPNFKCVEFRDNENIENYGKLYPSTNECMYISSSDAHRLCDINTDTNYFEVPEEYSHNVREYIFGLISGSKDT